MLFCSFYLFSVSLSVCCCCLSLLRVLFLWKLSYSTCNSQNFRQQQTQLHNLLCHLSIVVVSLLLLLSFFMLFVVVSFCFVCIQLLMFCCFSVTFVLFLSFVYTPISALNYKSLNYFNMYLDWIRLLQLPARWPPPRSIYRAYSADTARAIQLLVQRILLQPPSSSTSSCNWLNTRITHTQYIGTRTPAHTHIQTGIEKGRNADTHTHTQMSVQCMGPLVVSTFRIVYRKHVRSNGT